MADFKELQTQDELGQIWKESAEKPVLVLKHSTTCPISAGHSDSLRHFWNPVLIL